MVVVVDGNFVINFLISLHSLRSITVGFASATTAEFHPINFCSDEATLVESKSVSFPVGIACAKQNIVQNTAMKYIPVVLSYNKQNKEDYCMPGIKIIVGGNTGRENYGSN